MRKPRWFWRLRAYLGGYFWKPCPLCDRMWSGLEWALDGLPGVMVSPCDGLGICTVCKANGLATEPLP